MKLPSTGMHGACLRSDAVAVLGEYRVRAALEDGELVSTWAGVVAEPSRAADPRTIVASAVLAGGDSVIVAGPTAARLHGCTAAEMLPVHLVAPYGHWMRSVPGLVVHNGRFLDRDRDCVDGLAVLGLERVVTDLLCRSRPQDALAVTDQVLARFEPTERSAFRARIADRLDERPDPRGTRAARQLLQLATGRAESPAESWLLWTVVDLGFPVPEANWSVRDLDGVELYRLDLAWPTLRIAVEYDGYAAHAGRGEQDAARIRDLERRGWLVIIVGAADLGEPVRLERELSAALSARGWDLRQRRVGAARRRRHREWQAS
ncbi:hypothetical protein ACFQE5_00965 [Pseudonocardia hispaniensis]|uniref:DUF559 domain-containing protein n=1 Tax=Pseudonocardia hispaniensis TaxID=904933 RepID=A0ABW1IWL3_9PSEU